MTHSKGSQCIGIFHAYNLRTKAPVTQPNRRNAADMLHLVAENFVKQKQAMWSSRMIAASGYSPHVYS
ncbi:hypothetical protein BGAL_0668g00050 [Botrytis galanthina]|uniref:Uncharacterized protein n=1 Tax=Botrytis galanthina TaxID=278940 RepID=A0A4S8QKG6_9HELO|nr:hypothetical protein BGAL_0668g00050 [Botrytis galanthina]